MLDQRSAAVERGAAAIAALIESVRHEHVEDDVSGVAGELDRLDRSAPRGRSVVERSLRSFLEGARADVLARRSTTRVRAAQALVRLAEDGASLVVERVDDALAPTVEEREADVLVDTGSAVVVEPVDGVEPTDTDSLPADQPEPDTAAEKPSKKDDGKKKSSKDDGKKKSSKDDGKKKSKKKSSKDDGKKKRKE
ncbi:hypothetical protein P9139_16330 [Curtobacterium flaccumfaciens]|nr:hypothetical protein P9139_16330 [Curtobacterium flaccumfaciens]